MLFIQALKLTRVKKTGCVDTGIFTSIVKSKNNLLRNQFPLDGMSYASVKTVENVLKFNSIKFIPEKEE